MDRIKTVRHGNFTTIDNTIVRDERASLRAKGLLLTVFSFPDTWDFTVLGLMKVLKERKGAIYRVIDELIRLGYCKRTTRPRKNGHFGGSTYTFYENPADRIPFTASQKRDPINGTLINTYNKEEPDSEPILRDPQTQKQVDSYVRVRDEYVGQGDDFFANLESSGPNQTQSRFLIDVEASVPKPQSEKSVPEYAHRAMYRLCFMAETIEEINVLNSTQRGRVASILGKLRDADVDFNKIDIFESWWKGTWMSKNKESGQYMPPRPEQVQEYWNAAMKAYKPPVISDNGKPEQQYVPKPVTMEDIEKAMRSRREGE